MYHADRSTPVLGALIDFMDEVKVKVIKRAIVKH
jgi:hypothetical protein